MKVEIRPAMNILQEGILSVQWSGASCGQTIASGNADVTQTIRIHRSYPSVS